MEAGKTKLADAQRSQKLDLIDAMVMAADDKVSDDDVAEVERSACPTCGSCSGMFTANSMNCLTEALGLSLPGNGTRGGHPRRPRAAVQARRPPGRGAVPSATTSRTTRRVLPRTIGFKAFENAMTLDIAMGGSTNTILHLLAAAQEAEHRLHAWPTSTACRACVPQLCKVAPNTHKYHIEDVHRAGGIMAILGELDRAGLLHTDVPTVHAPTMGDALDQWDIMRTQAEAVHNFLQGRPRAAFPRRSPSARPRAGRASTWTAPKAASARCEHAFSQEGGLAVLPATSRWTAAW